MSVRADEPCVLCDPDSHYSGPLTDDNAHRECMLRSVSGGIGHLVAHPYWCVEQGDPDGGLTYRQSALLVARFVEVVGVEAAVNRWAGR